LKEGRKPLKKWNFRKKEETMLENTMRSLISKGERAFRVE